MADELDAQLGQPSEAEQRIKNLSSKVREEAEARETAVKAQEAAEKRADEAERLAAFNESFVDIISDNPSAKEYKDELKSKVLSGMTIEDAKIWVKGKATSSDSPAGGSATITPSTSAPRTATELTQEDRRKALIEAQEKGDLSWSNSL